MDSLFVNKESIVRTIWGKADTVLFIFAGAAAEFALNKAVDWLYYTGRLPADPLGRLFSTVEYSQQIIFSENEAALQAIDKITAIHKGVEKNRGTQIPDWAYLDVLFLLVDYSIRSFELLERKLTETEKLEIYHVFERVGARMRLAGLPSSYQEYCALRKDHLQQNLISSEFTIDLYRKYKQHLGTTRYIILKQVQFILVPNHVKKILPVGNMVWIKPFMQLYKLLRLFKIEGFFKNALLPDTYKEQIKGLEAQN